MFCYLCLDTANKAFQLCIRMSDIAILFFYVSDDTVPELGDWPLGVRLRYGFGNTEYKPDD